MMPTKTAIDIRPLQGPADALAFRQLNTEWITKLFTLEAKDREILEHPEETILRKGGFIFMVLVDGEPVGCAALIAAGDGVYELSKMAVRHGFAA